MKRFILTNGIQQFLKPEGGGGGSGGGESEHLHEQEHEKAGEEKGKEKAHVPESEGFAKFNERFSAKKNAPIAEGGKPTPEQVEDARKQTERLAAEREAQRKQSQETGRKMEENKRAGSNVPKILDEKRQAEKDRDEYKAKLEKYEKEEKPAIEQKIKALEEQIEKGVSSKKEAELTGKITELESTLKEREDSLVNENQGLRKRLAFYNLQEDDDFKEKYVRPVQEAYSEAVEVLTDDRQKAALRQALAINGQVLRARDPEEKSKLTRERDDFLNQVAEDLKGISSQRFVGAITRYITASQEHAKAMQDHEVTTAEIRQQAQQKADRARAERLASWDKTFKVTQQQYDDETKLSPDEVKLAKELNLDVDSELTKANLIASQTVLGKSSMLDAIDMIHRGRVYSVQKVRIQILEKQLKDRDEVITKLRGAGTEGGNKTSEGGGSGKKTENERPTRAEWQSKFRPPGS